MVVIFVYKSWRNPKGNQECRFQRHWQHKTKDED